MRESGRVFAVPTYFFIVNMVVLLGVGLSESMTGALPDAPSHEPRECSPSATAATGC